MTSNLHVNAAPVDDIARHDFIQVIEAFLAKQKQNVEHHGNISKVLISSRRDAFNCLKESGFPSARHEDWKYTDFNHVLNKNFKLADVLPAPCVSNVYDWINKYIADNVCSISSINSAEVSTTDVVVMLNGRFNPELSVIDSSRVSVLSTSEYWQINPDTAAAKFEKKFIKATQYGKPYTTDGIENFVNACWHDGVAVDVAKNLKTEIKLRVLNVFTDGANGKILNNKNIFSVGENSQVSITEEYLSVISDDSNNNGFNYNLLADIRLGSQAICKHYLLQNHNSNVYHISHYNVTQSKNSQYHNFNINIGGLVSRQNINVLQNEDYAECILNGVFLPKAKQHMDSHLKIFHNASHGISTQNYRGVLTERGHGVFNGMVYVAEGTLNNNAMQSNKNVLLSKHSEVDTKPELQIYSEDVICSHGATIGRLDDNALFYLRSRGISELDAKHMLIVSFINHLIDKIKDNDILSWLDGKLSLALNYIAQKS